MCGSGLGSFGQVTPVSRKVPLIPLGSAETQEELGDPPKVQGTELKVYLPRLKERALIEP